MGGSDDIVLPENYRASVFEFFRKSLPESWHRFHLSSGVFHGRADGYIQKPCGCHEFNPFPGYPCMIYCDSRQDLEEHLRAAHDVAEDEISGEIAGQSYSARVTGLIYTRIRIGCYQLSIGGDAVVADSRRYFRQERREILGARGQSIVSFSLLVKAKIIAIEQRINFFCLFGHLACHC